jgi:hypothetical protein
MSTADLSVAVPVAALVRAARQLDPRELVEGVPEVDETLPYLDLARAVALAFAGDPLAPHAVSDAVDAAYDVGGIYEDFTLFYGAALHIAARYDDAALFERLRRVIDDDGSALPAGLAGHRALVDALAPGGASDQATEAAFHRALAHYATWRSPVHTARAQAAYGVWLRGHGRTDEAEPMVGQARERYAALGATAWLEELEAQHVETSAP